MCNVFGTLHGACAAYIIDPYGYSDISWFIASVYVTSDARSPPWLSLVFKTALMAQACLNQWTSFGTKQFTGQFRPHLSHSIWQLFYSGAQIRIVSTARYTRGQVRTMRCEVCHKFFRCSWIEGLTLLNDRISWDLGQGKQSAVYIRCTFDDETKNEIQAIGVSYKVVNLKSKRGINRHTMYTLSVFYCRHNVVCLYRVILLPDSIRPCYRIFSAFLDIREKPDH